MMKVFISKQLFNLQKKYSTGLITSLKKLSGRGFILYVDKKYRFDSKILLMLKNENIILNMIDPNSLKYDFIISTSHSKNKNVIQINEKGRIKNINSATEYIIKKLRTVEIKRKTKETEIAIKLCLDGEGKSKIKTGIGFFDHMLDQIARHGNIDLSIYVKGDLHVDEHHTIEDTGIALGEAIRKALGDKKGIKRYGYFLPMDDSIAQCAIDIGGRHYLNFRCKFEREKVGEFPTELTEEFFRGLSAGMLSNIYIKCQGKNDHHKIEVIFKAFAKALNEACRIDERANNLLPSTKGLL